ncbi:MAG: glycosyltransferase family 2 protein [Flavobacteriales bacterium]|jgi:cellulose synthase/poly-beta-1,6-N-acetylglucosamine synthase-like glycosyltransferase|nr:glycosyltransferase family 2 protein [Flavobacteriales bacterium]
MHKTRVSVVIPCYNEESYIGNCLSSIFAQDYPLELIQVFVADGRSTDKTRAVLSSWNERWENVHMLDNPERHTPQALNIGIQASDSHVVIILGAHAEMFPDYISNCINVLNDHPEVACVGGVLDHVNENRGAEIIAKAMSSPFGVGNVRFRTGGQPGYVDTVAFGAYRREVFNKVGLFDTDLVRNQDDEFNYRILASGDKIWFDPSIRSKYFVRSSFEKLFKQYRQYGYWKVFVNVKHKTVTTVRQLVPAIFVFTMVSLILLGFAFPAFWSVFASALVLWFLVAMGAAMAARTSSALLGGVVLAFFILHVSYGLGYLEGIVRFAILRLKPRSSRLETTR